MADKENQVEGISANWAMLHFRDSDPGSEFEVHPHTAIMAKKESLRPGLKVSVRYGKAKLQAEVVAVAESQEYLNTNFAQITRTFIGHAGRRATYPLKKRLFEENQNVQNHNNNIEEPNKAQAREWFFDEKNREEAFNAYCNVHEDYLALKKKFDNLQHMYDLLRTSSGHSTTDTEVQEERASKSPPAIDDVLIDDENDLVYFGRNRTAVPKSVYVMLDWTSCSACTRKLLVTVFSKDILATHTLTGKPSPAFLHSGKAIKQQLDPVKTCDIIQLVTNKCKVTASIVRGCITTKCADENKLLKKRLGMGTISRRKSNKCVKRNGSKGRKHTRKTESATSSTSEESDYAELYSPRRTKRLAPTEVRQPSKRILLE